MPVTLERGEELTMIRLDGEVGIADAAELKGLLLQALGSGQQMRVSLLTTTELDVTAVELLWAARREAKASSISFAVEGPVPPIVISTVLQAGFDDFLANGHAAQDSEGTP
jgi:hypothetical protein